MANPFYIQPADPMPGLNAAFTGYFKGAEAAQAREKEEAIKQKLALFAQNVPNMTPMEVGQYVLMNPDVAQHITSSVDATNKMTTEENMRQAWDVVTGKVSPKDALFNRAEEIVKRGGDAKDTIGLAQDAVMGGDLAMKSAYAFLASHDPKGLGAYLRATSPEKDTTPATDIDDFVSDFKAQWRLDHDGKEPPPGEVNKARLAFKRAQAPEAGAVRREVLTAEGELQPQIAADVAEAETAAKLGVEGEMRPQIAADVKQAETRASEEERRAQDLMERGQVAAESTAVLRRGIELLEKVKTGGVNAVKLAAKRFFGVEGADEGELSNALAKAVLSQLRETFGAQFTEQEGKRLERIEAGFSKSPENNRRLLIQTLRIAERTANRAIKAAEKRGDKETANDIRELLKFDLSMEPDRDYPEGTIIQNEAGEMRILRNGEWVPYNG